MKFSEVLEKLRDGYRAARAGWNGKGMWIALSPGREVQTHELWSSKAKAWAAQQGGLVEVLPFFIMKTADDKILCGWLASQTDMVADDWEYFE